MPLSQQVVQNTLFQPDTASVNLTKRKNSRILMNFSRHRIFFFVQLTLLPDNLLLRQTSDCTLTCFLLLFYPPGDLMLRMLKNAVYQFRQTSEQNIPSD